MGGIDQPADSRDPVATGSRIGRQVQHLHVCILRQAVRHRPETLRSELVVPQVEANHGGTHLHRQRKRSDAIVTQTRVTQIALAHLQTLGRSGVGNAPALLAALRVHIRDLSVAVIVTMGTSACSG